MAWPWRLFLSRFEHSELAMLSWNVDLFLVFLVFQASCCLGDFVKKALKLCVFDAEQTDVFSPHN
jgi:hypothetical protein